MSSCFAVDGSTTEVRAWSVTRLRFEPRDWQLKYREELRVALAGLRPQPGQSLLAEYEAPDDTFVDVENVLLYNVGGKALAHLTRLGISGRRGRSLDSRHHVRYRLVASLPDPGAGPRVGHVLADLAVPLPSTTGRWWAALRPATVLEQAPTGDVRDFTVDVILAGPGASRLGLTPRIKSLLDGLISCFHVHDCSQESQVKQHLATLGRSAESWSLLTSKTCNALGVRVLVRPTRKGVRWNPADERCQAFRVQAQELQQWKLSAELRSTGSPAFGVTIETGGGI